MKNLYFDLKDERLFSFLGYQSELDVVPLKEDYLSWSKDTLEKKLEKVELYKIQITNEAKSR